MIGECAFNIQSYHINFPHILFPMISMISHYINIALPTLGSTTGLPWQCPTLFSTPGLGIGEEEQIQIRYGRRPLKSTPLPDRTYPGQNPQKLLLLQRRLFQRRSQQLKRCRLPFLPPIFMGAKRSQMSPPDVRYNVEPFSTNVQPIWGSWNHFK